MRYVVVLFYNSCNGHVAKYNWRCYNIIQQERHLVPTSKLHFLMAAVAQPALPVLDSSSAPPNLFDGTTRLYICLTCPYAQRAWSAANLKGLDNIELVAIDLRDKPKWYLEKVYPLGKVPSLEHNGKVTGESLDLLEYIDQNFEGPSLFPQGSGKAEATKDLLKFSDEVIKQLYTAFKNKDAKTAYAEKHISPVLDHLETALGKFQDEGPFFLGQLSAVDLAYAPFFERFELLAPELLEYNIFGGRPRLAKWFEAINTVDAYASTKSEPKVVLERLKKFLGR